LYAFFVALGFGLLKDNGKICYIIPQTILSAGDLDVLRYHLAKKTTIEKIITFEGNLFIGRGMKQKKPVATSSLIFIAKKNAPRANHSVKIINYKPYNEKQGSDFDAYFRSRKKQEKNILQSKLLENVGNWNFIKQNSVFLEMLAIYENSSVSIEEYRRGVLAHYDEITIDGGINLDESKILTFAPKNGFYKLFNPKKNNYHRFSISEHCLFYSKDSKIEFIPGSQGMKVFENKYKIIWKTRFNEIFQFSGEQNLILKGNQSLVISSDNKQVLLFLFAILNAPVSLLVLREMLKMPNEAAYIVPITAIKQYIRIPKITNDNAHIKDEIIKQTEALLALEKPVLKDIVDFPQTAMQTFDFIRIEDNIIVLTAGDKNYIAKISANKIELVKKIIEAEYFSKSELTPNKSINISDLLFLPTIDFDAQAKIKATIDDLVFALYFNVALNTLKIENTDMLHDAVSMNEFYPLVNTSRNKI
jgi:hypothetical protein